MFYAHIPPPLFEDVQAEGFSKGTTYFFSNNLSFAN